MLHLNLTASNKQRRCRQISTDQEDEPKRQEHQREDKEVLVIDETGENLGILSTDMAVQMVRGLETCIFIERKQSLGCPLQLY